MTFAPMILTRALPFALMATFAATSLAFAQDTAAPAAEPAPAADAAPVADTTELDAPAAPGDLSMGTEAGGTGGIGQTYTVESFDAWEQRCVRTADGADPCALYQLLKDGDGNAVAEFSMFNLTDGGKAVAGATIVVPLETLLGENLVMAIDTAAPRAYPFTFCSTIGCIARVGFTAAEVEQFKKGASASLTIVPVVAPTEKVKVDLSLTGFTAGYAAVSAANAK